MRIAICSQGDWNDAEVTPETLQQMVMAGDITASGTDTGKLYAESPALPVFNADSWPGWTIGFDYIRDAPDHNVA